MKYMEVSQKINLTRDADVSQIKESLLVRLRRAFDVENLKETEEGFHIDGATGGPDSITRHARASLDVKIEQQGEHVRVLVHGHTRMARSLLILYTGMFFFLLVLGLAPGSIETSYETSGAMDALVFLLFGVLIFYDLDKKMLEPKEHIQDMLQSLGVEFG